MTSAGWERRFQWVSSTDGPSIPLDLLDRRLTEFYSRSTTRAAYQDLIDAPESSQPATELALTRAVVGRRPASVLEIGCGSGRLYRQLRAAGLDGSYVGLEMAANTIEANRVRHPEATWECGSVYGISFSQQFDVVFAYFVLEHCVYPKTALDRLMTFVAAGGSLLLVFPDFVVAGRFASQALGRKRGLARDHLRRGAVVDALVTLYDSRIRLPRALKRAIQRCGPFPVNLNPRCFIEPAQIEPDVDAVYIASTDEVNAWATAQGCAVGFPAGREGHFSENALIEIRPPAPGNQCAAGEGLKSVQ